MCAYGPAMRCPAQRRRRSYVSRAAARLRQASLLAGLGFCVILGAEGAAAAQFSEGTSGLTELSLQSRFVGGAASLEQNPAFLAELAGWELSYAHRQALGTREARKLSGDAFHAAIPLWKLRIAAGVSHLRPEHAPDYALAHWGGAMPFGRRFALGFGVRHLASGEAAALAGAHSADVGLAALLREDLRLSVMLRDLLAPTGLGIGGRPLRGSYRAGLRFTPRWARGLGLEAELGLDDAATPGARLRLDGALPGFGQLWAAALGQSLDSDAVFSAMAGLEWRMGHAALSLAAVSNEPHEGAPDAWLSATVRQALPEARTQLGGTVLRVKLDATGGREAVRQLRQVDAALAAPGLRALILELHGRPSFATAQEWRALLRHARRRGLRTACHAETLDKAGLYLCAAAEQRWMDPAGFARLGGFRSEGLSFGGALQQLGVRAQFLRIGDFKSAPEQWHGPRSAPATAQQQRLLRDLVERYLDDLAKDLKVSRAQLQAGLDEGLVTAERAKGLGWIQGLVDRTELSKALGSGFTLAPFEAPTPSASLQLRPRIAVLSLDGMMTDGESMQVPLVGVTQTGSDSFVTACRQAQEDPTVRAVLLRIDSPGGSALAADRIWRCVRKLATQKPVIASVGGMAASAAYYVASAADRIYANPSSLVGSIGIFFGKVDARGLADRLGVRAHAAQEGALAGSESLFEPFTGAQRRILAARLQDWYGLFLRRVAEGRELELETIDAVARGRVWRADAAEAAVLTDVRAGLHAALSELRRRARLDADCDVVELLPRPKGLLETLLGAPAERQLKAGLAAWLPARMLTQMLPLMALMQGAVPQPLALADELSWQAY